MQPSFMEILLTDAAAKAVCWTLVHSLWQGLVVALVAGAVILCTRKSAAVLRYNLLAADLVLFLVAAVGTFSYELRQDGAGAATQVGVVVADGGQPASGGGVTIHARYDLPTTSVLERVGMFLNEHAGVVVIVWMGCLLVQLLRMTGGLYRMHHLRRRRVFLPAECWERRMAVLMERLGVTKKVRLLQSGSVAMPVTFGFLKPSILVPLGMLANLPAEQVETILLHELAHIRRSDYLSNLLLHIGEAVFFFNPGVRWVAWLLREEREACCDDLVLAGVKDRNNYFEALIAFGEYAIGRGSMALPLGNGKSDLLWRIRRMLNHENKKLQLMEKTILSFGLMAVVAIGLVSMKGPGGSMQISRGAGRSSVRAIVDTVPVVAGKTTIKTLDMARDMTVAATLDSMSVSMTGPGPNAITVQVSGQHLSMQTAAAMMHMAKSITTMNTAVAAVGAPMMEPGVVPPPPAPPIVKNDWIKEIIADLKAKGLVKAVDPLAFQLDVSGLTVNGVQVSAEVFAFFRDKYVTSPENNFYYRHRGGSTSATVNVY
jgi:beta-lactamase regulating signal transducer with metallopeptidase domain